MKATATVAFLVLFFALPPEATGNPVEKVLSLLSDLEAKIIKEGAAAQKTYEEFSEWCEDRSKHLGFEIKTSKREVESLKATISDQTASASSFEAKIQELGGEISSDERDLTAAKDIRGKEAADFKAEETELIDTISTIERAIAILEREMQKGASMLQLHRANNLEEALAVMVKASFLSTSDGQRLTALAKAAARDADSDFGAPDPAAYQGKSGNIVEVLEDLLGEAKGQLSKARSREEQSLHAFEMLAQNLEDEIKYGTKELDQAKKSLAGAHETIAHATGDLAITTKSLSVALSTKGDLHADCMEQAQDFEAETKSRGEELHAIATAKKVISESAGGDGGAADISYALDQQAVSLIQLDHQSLNSGKDLANFEALNFVRDLARKLKEPALTQLASRMSAAMRSGSGDDGFAKVKGLIRDLIERLLAEGEADAQEKSYCDKELGETSHQKEDKEDELAKLTAAIDTMTARIALLKNQLGALSKQLADLAGSQAEMDKIRTEEHTVFVSQKAEMDQGLEGIKRALKMLKDYYGSGGDHEKATGAGEGIIGLIEVIESDFTKTVTELVATESTSAAEYDKQTKENQVLKATLEQDVKYKSKESTELQHALGETNSDRGSVQAELDAVVQYYERVKERCIAKPSSYEERTQRREEEIAGLKHALEILAGEDVRSAAASLLQQRKRFLGLHTRAA